MVLRKAQKDSIREFTAEGHMTTRTMQTVTHKLNRKVESA